MQAITIGMIVYCVICAVLVAGVSLYQELKRNKGLPPDERKQDVPGENPASPQPTSGHAGKRAA
jgi:hypothetical protein